MYKPRNPVILNLTTDNTVFVVRLCWYDTDNIEDYESNNSHIVVFVFLAVVFSKLFISNQNYIWFYKLICYDSVWREEAYPKISPH
jgi:hypothetical protein